MLWNFLSWDPLPRPPVSYLESQEFLNIHHSSGKRNKGSLEHQHKHFNEKRERNMKRFQLMHHILCTNIPNWRTCIKLPSIRIGMIYSLLLKIYAFLITKKNKKHRKTILIRIIYRKKSKKLKVSRNKFRARTKRQWITNNAKLQMEEMKCMDTNNTSPSTIMSIILGGTMISSTNFANFDSATWKNINPVAHEKNW